MPVIKCDECMKTHSSSPLDEVQLCLCYHKFKEMRKAESEKPKTKKKTRNK